MDWAYVWSDVEFYGRSVSELVAYVLLIAGVIAGIEWVVTTKLSWGHKPKKI